METVILSLLIAITATVVGFLIGKKKEKEIQNTLTATTHQLDEMRYRLEDSQKRLEESQHAARLHQAEANEKIERQTEDIRKLSEEKASAITQIENLTQKLEEERKDAEKRDEKLKIEFTNLSNAILKEQGKDFSALSSQTVKELVEPMREQLKQMKEQVAEYYDHESKQRSQLEGVVRTLSQQSEKIGNDANNLANALKGESKTQGNWGEMILQQILEQSGLKEGEQYITQYTITDETGKIITRIDETDGKAHKMIPDVIVRLPYKRCLVIDSKVSLTAYSDAINSESEKERNERMKAHATSVINHINELAKKDYTKYIEGAPGFVVMFIPNEHAYYEALKVNPNLWNEAWNKNVLLVNQTNLITMIRLAVDLWAQDNREKNYQEVLKRATAMYDKFTIFTEKMTKLGTAVDSIQKMYGEAMTTLSEGRGSLGRKMEELKKMDMVNSNKQAKIGS